jgi:hypothetical protein
LSCPASSGMSSFSTLPATRRTLGQRLEDLPAPPGVAARHDDRRRRVPAGRPADELPGLEIRPRGDRAGIDDADIGLGGRSSPGCAPAVRAAGPCPPSRTVDLAAQRNRATFCAPWPDACVRDLFPACRSCTVPCRPMPAAFRAVPHHGEPPVSARFLKMQSRPQPGVCQGAIISGYHSGIVLKGFIPHKGGSRWMPLPGSCPRMG